MDEVYVAWGVYIVAVGLHLVFWPQLAQLAMFKRRLGGDSMAGSLIAVPVITGLLMFVWPFVALGRLYYDNQPSIFSAVVMILGSWVLGLLISVALKVMAGPFVNTGDEIKSASRMSALADLSVVLLFAATAIAFLLVAYPDGL